MTLGASLLMRLLAASLVVVASGCIPIEAGIPDDLFQIANGTGQDVRLHPVRESGPDRLSPPPPNDGNDDWLVEDGVVTGLGLFTESDGDVPCVADGLEALDPDTGEVIAVWDEPICGGVSWNIDPPDTGSLTP